MTQSKVTRNSCLVFSFIFSFGRFFPPVRSFFFFLLEVHLNKVGVYRLIGSRWLSRLPFKPFHPFPRGGRKKVQSLDLYISSKPSGGGSTDGHRSRTSFTKTRVRVRVRTVKNKKKKEWKNLPPSSLSAFGRAMVVVSKKKNNNNKNNKTKQRATLHRLQCNEDERQRTTPFTKLYDVSRT